MQAFRPGKGWVCISGKPDMKLHEKKDRGTLGFINNWTSCRKIKLAPIEKIELYSIELFLHAQILFAVTGNKSAFICVYLRFVFQNVFVPFSSGGAITKIHKERKEAEGE